MLAMDIICKHTWTTIQQNPNGCTVQCCTSRDMFSAFLCQVAQPTAFHLLIPGREEVPSRRPFSSHCLAGTRSLPGISSLSRMAEMQLFQTVTRAFCKPKAYESHQRILFLLLGFSLRLWQARLSCFRSLKIFFLTALICSCSKNLNQDMQSEICANARKQEGQSSGHRVGCFRRWIKNQQHANSTEEDKSKAQQAHFQEVQDFRLRVGKWLAPGCNSQHPSRDEWK